MKETKAAWVFTAMGDDLALNDRLNRWAEQGFEWEPSGDGSRYLSYLKRTDRTELRYFVETASLLRSDNQLRAQVERRIAMGWEPLGTVNGLDIYRSAPCRKAETPIRETNAVRWTSIASALLALVALLLCLQWPLLGVEWFLTDLGALLWLSRFVVLPASAVWSVWRVIRVLVPAKQAAHSAVVFLRGIIAALFRLWLLLLAAAFVLTLLPLPWAAGVLTLGILLRLAFGFESDPVEDKLRWSARSSIRFTICCVGAVLLLTIGLHQLGITNSVRVYSVGNGVPAEAVGNGVPAEASGFLHAEDLTANPGSVFSSEYSRRSSLLAEQESYTETTEQLRMDCICYRSAIPMMRTYLQRKLEAAAAGEEHTALVIEDNGAVLLRCSQKWEKDPSDAMRALLEGEQR